MRRHMMTIAVLLAASVFFITAALVAAQEDLKEHRDCAHCGMDRKAFGYSRMLIVYEDGTAVGVCSLHCAVVELDGNPARKAIKIRVADRDSRELLEAEQAYWVIGGKRPGVMTRRPKWAFRSKAAAEAFMTSNGGRLITWQEALEAAREDIKKEAR